MSNQYKAFQLFFDGAEKTVHLKKQYDEDDNPSIKIWWYSDDGEEQVIEYGYKTAELRDEYWQELDIYELIVCLNAGCASVVSSENEQ